MILAPLSDPVEEPRGRRQSGQIPCSKRAAYGAHREGKESGTYMWWNYESEKS